jgi:virulence factor Mce-like protein
MRRNQRKGLSYTAVALIVLAVAAIGTYLAFTKEIPFRGHYEVNAVVPTANQLKPGFLVRIAGVNVGKVTKVETVGNGEPAARITMQIDDAGLPIHKDATLKIRPRIIFEGNFFVDISPGSPSAPTLGDGDTIPINQTAGPVQFDQVLGTFKSDTRSDLRVLLSELNKGYSNGGAQALNRTMPYWEPAYKNSAIVSEATLGVLEHDLSEYIAGAAKVAEGLDRNAPQLQSLITDLRRTAGALAARDQELSTAIGELPQTLRAGMPALEQLNGALPSLRRFTAALRPGIRSSGPALDAQIPFVRELRGLVRPSELRGLAGDLRPTVPDLAATNKATIPLLEQARAASSCQNEVVVPWTLDKIQDEVFPAHGPVYTEQAKALVGLAGESRSFDANGQWFRVQLNAAQFATPAGEGRFFLTNRPILGSNPPKPNARPPLRDDIPCETQQQPDLRTQPLAPPQPSFRVTPGDPAAAAARTAKAQTAAVKWLREQLRRQGRDIPVVDDLLSKAELPRIQGVTK